MSNQALNKNECKDLGKRNPPHHVPQAVPWLLVIPMVDIFSFLLVIASMLLDTESLGGMLADLQIVHPLLNGRKLPPSL